jgi:hypothetical protein
MMSAGPDAVRQEQREQTRLALGAMLIPVFFVIMFPVCIIGTYHQPHPNDIKIGVVGPATQTAPLRDDIEKTAGSAFDVRPVTTPAAAADDVRQRDLDATFVPTADPQQPATVIVASGGGRIVATAVETLARNVTTSPPKDSNWSWKTCVHSRPATSSGSASSCL